jgi:hypothetical protein
VLRNLILFPVVSFLVGLLVLGAIGQRPELIGHGRTRTVLDSGSPGLLDRWREEIAAGDWDQLARKARDAGLSEEQLREAGRKLGINGEQAREALGAWAQSAPGYDAAANAASAIGDQAQEHRVARVRALDVLAVTLVGMPPVLIGFALQRRLRNRPVRASLS